MPTPTTTTGSSSKIMGFTVCLQLRLFPLAPSFTAQPVSGPPVFTRFLYFLAFQELAPLQNILEKELNHDVAVSRSRQLSVTGAVGHETCLF